MKGLRFLAASSCSLLVVLLAAGCARRSTEGAADGGAATKTATAELEEEGASASGAGADASADDVEPVYPIEADAPVSPRAARLCEALSARPEQRRAACCGTTPGIVLTSECTRMLGASLRHRALELDDTAIDACEAALDRTLAGCDWVGPFPPGPPAECLGLLRGTLGAGARCRSSLECAGSLHCAGLGPTSPGRCAPPGDTGQGCGGSVDPLAGFTRQGSVEHLHPECRERCIGHRCAPPARDGEACRTTVECRPGSQCLVDATSATGYALPDGGPPGKTTPSRPASVCTPAPLPANEGEACPGGTCSVGLQCVRGVCTHRKAPGQPCTSDFECAGGCVRAPGATRGTCGARCDLR